jgi:hypothetical protein
MKATFHPYREKLCHGNIKWAECTEGNSYYRYSRFARGGKFTKDHPVAPGVEVLSGNRGDTQLSDSPTIDAFRDRGYWASCFPEGDGITWKPLNGQSDEQCLKDIIECFPQLEIAPASTRNER